MPKVMVGGAEPIALPRPVTRFDRLKRGPNDGTAWEGPNEESNPTMIFSTNEEKNPNRHTQWANQDEKDPHPETRPVAQVIPKINITERPKGNLTDEQVLAMYRMHGEEGMVPAGGGDVKGQVAEAIAPLVSKMDQLIDVLLGGKPKKPKKEKKHVERNGGARGVRGRPRKSRIESVPTLGSAAEPVADPPPQPEAPREPA